MVEGQERAWSGKPASGNPLRCYDGQPFGPKGVPFSLQEVRRIFSVLSSINFCPCRDLDESNLGAAAMDARFVEFVTKDLLYSKEHADLRARAEAWDAAERPQRMLLQAAAAEHWADWVKVSTKAHAFPEPTDQMREYVEASSRQARFRRKALRAGGIVLFAVITVLAVLAGVSYLRAMELQYIAVNQQAIATAMLLSDVTQPQQAAELHALLRAAEIAQCISYTSLVMPPLTAATSYLVTRPRFFELKSHQDRVNKVAFDPSGEFLATASYDGTVHIRSVRMGALATGCHSSQCASAWLPWRGC